MTSIWRIWISKMITFIIEKREEGLWASSRFSSLDIQIFRMHVLSMAFLVRRTPKIQQSC